jgi:hypothetical protein
MNKVLYSIINCWVGLNIELHLVFTFFSSFRHLVSMMLANFVSSKWCLGLLQKY